MLTSIITVVLANFITIFAIVTIIILFSAWDLFITRPGDQYEIDYVELVEAEIGKKRNHEKYLTKEEFIQTWLIPEEWFNMAMEEARRRFSLTDDWAIKVDYENMPIKPLWIDYYNDAKSKIEINLD